MNLFKRFFKRFRKNPIIGQWKMIDFTANGKVPEVNIIDKYIFTIKRKGQGFGNLDNGYDQNFEWTLIDEKFSMTFNGGTRFFDVILLTDDYFIYQVQHNSIYDGEVVEETLITTYKRI